MPAPSPSLAEAAVLAAPGPRPARSRLAGPRLLAGLAFPLLLAVAWELAVRWGYAQGRLMPPPSRIGQTLLELFRSGELGQHVEATLLRVAAGFALGALAGTLFGAVVGMSEPLKRFFDPTLQALRAVPSIAWVPLFLLWLGIFEASKVALIAVGVFFPVYLGVASAIEGIDRKLVEVGRVFRLGRVAMLRRVLLPAVLPEWLTSLRSGLGLGFMFVVAAEFMGASEGLGYLLVDGQQMGRPDRILAAIITFAVLGKLCDTLLVLATRPLVRWQDTARRTL